MSPLLFGLALGGAAVYFFDPRRSRRRRDVNDQVLVERVRSTMGHQVAHPGAIDVYAADGEVTLSGYLFSHEHPELIESTWAVPGVTNVVDQLAVYETAEGISELRSRREPPRYRTAGTFNPRY